MNANRVHSSLPDLSATDSAMTIVVAVGGNALIRRGEFGTIEQQRAHSEQVMAPVAALAQAGHRIVITHGNGPIVGNILLRNEAARELVSPMPLHIAGADSQGGVGYMLRTALVNQLRLLDVERSVVALVTCVLVDGNDPAFSTPDKPIGPFYSADTAARLAREHAWSFVQEPERGSRRIVASPEPLEIVELSEIAHLCELGTIVIAAGGGGVPTTRGEGGLERGADAVVDKDRTSALLGTKLNADALVIIMEEDAVYSDWGTPGQQELRTLSVANARTRLASGQFPAGSIAPKIKAGIAFTEGTGNPTMICSVGSLNAAFLGRAGTRIVTD